MTSAATLELGDRPGGGQEREVRTGQAADEHTSRASGEEQDETRWRPASPGLTLTLLQSAAAIPRSRADSGGFRPGPQVALADWSIASGVSGPLPQGERLDRAARPDGIPQSDAPPIAGDLWHRQESEAAMQRFDELDKASMRDDHPDFRAGDTVKVHVKVVEGTRSRIQVFQGVVIRRHGGGVGETFTVRKVSFGVGVERTFPLHTPIIDKIEVVTRGDVRRAKLYYLRDLRGKAAKIKEKRETTPAS